jgi:hypothetical protein
VAWEGVDLDTPTVMSAIRRYLPASTDSLGEY